MKHDPPAERSEALVHALRELPRHPAPERGAGAARAAFVRGAGGEGDRLAGVWRVALPVVLASVVGVYLVWAFSLAIMVSAIDH